MATFKERIKELRIAKKWTQQEVADRLGVNKQTISQYERGVREPQIETLEAIADIFNVSLNYLVGKDNLTVRLINNSEYAIIEEYRNSSNVKSRKIPVLGNVAAGIPIEAVENIIDYEEITEEMARSGDFFGLQIHGDSMEPRMKEGDIVIVRKQEDAESGEVVIAMVNGNDACCKRLMKYQGGIQLLSNNPAYEPMMFTDEEITNNPVRILGKVVELRAKF